MTTLGAVVSAYVVPPKRRVKERVLLVGQAPGSDGDVDPVTGTMGERLAAWAGLDRTHADMARFYDTFGRANVLNHYPGPSGKGHAFPADEARAGARALLGFLVTYNRVVFCGKAVKDAFVGPFKDEGWEDAAATLRRLDPFDWLEGAPGLPRLAWMPHPSGVVLFWNDPRNVERVRLFLREVLTSAG